MEENKLLNDLADATALPKDFVKKELKRLIVAAGLKPEDLTMEQLRDITSALMLDVFSNVTENNNK